MGKYNKKDLPILTQKDIDLLEELSNACAVSGNERDIRKIVRREIQSIADSYEIDALGNVIAVKKAKTDKYMKVLIAAHMDEVGFMLVDEEDPGIFRFRSIGGIDPRSLAGKAVLVGPDHLHGVIGACPIHLTTPEDRKKTIKETELRIDIGAKNDSVKPGTFAYFATTFSEMGSSICGKALDNRLGVCNLIRIFKECPDNIELTAAFTVQEEIGCRGAKVAAFGRHPDIVIAIDSTPANDLPSWDGEESYIYKSKLGQGPAIYSLDSGTINDHRLISYFRDIADEYGIPSQYRQPAPGGTDAGSLHLTEEGYPGISISVPGRYAHSAASIARKSDWEAHLQLLLAGLANLDKDLLSKPR